MSSDSKVNYYALLQLPIVKKLKNKNKSLKNEIKVLKNVILYMESRLSNEKCCNIKKEVIEIIDDSSIEDNKNENITYSLPKDDEIDSIEFKKEPDWDYNTIKKEVQDNVKDFYNSNENDGEIKKVYTKSELEKLKSSIPSKS